MEVMDLWTLRIEHDYYQRSETSDFYVKISSDMRILLMRRSLLWRRKSVNEWCLSSFGNYALDDEDALTLELNTTGNLLPHVTELKWPVGNECYEVSTPVDNAKIVAKECMDRARRSRDQSGFMSLSVPFGKMDNQGFCPVTTCLSFQTVCKYWEYILVGRQQQNNRIFRLESKKNSIHFGDAKEIDFMGNRALQIRSLEKIPLQDYYPDTELTLWETVSVRGIQREHILFQTVPFPEPSLNLGIAPDTVYRVLYY